VDFNNIRLIRSQFPAAENSVYLETASTGLIPTYVYQAINDYQNHRYLTGGDSYWGHERMNSICMIEQSKQALAKMMNCDSGDITFGGNTSDILSYYIANIEISNGCNVIIPENLFLSGKYMWQTREAEGLELRYVPVRDGKIDEEELLSLTDEKTLAVHVDLVGSSTGYRINAQKIGEYCRKNNIHFIVDAAQGLGAMNVDCVSLKADIIAGNNYKWMQGYCGCGFGYIRKEIRDRLTQRVAGWMSDKFRFIQDSDRIQLRDDAERFVLGYPNVAGIYALSCVAQKYQELGGNNIERYLMHLRDYLEERVKETTGISMKYNFEEAQKSQIVYLKFYGESPLTHEMLQEAGVFCDVHETDSRHETELRIGLHYYNNEQDIDRFIETIVNLKGGKKNE